MHNKYFEFAPLAALVDDVRTERMIMTIINACTTNIKVKMLPYHW
jgi:hypothetical protein